MANERSVEKLEREEQQPFQITLRSIEKQIREFSVHREQFESPDQIGHRRVVSYFSNKSESSPSRQAPINDEDNRTEQINNAYFGFRKEPVLHKKTFEAISPRPVAVSRYFTKSSFVSPTVKNASPNVKRVKQSK